jgi:hypothetical protein
VRAEFAGRSTRCPGCSAPLTVAAGPAPPPARAEPEERPRPRPRPRETDDESRRPTGEWAPVELAFRREQVAVACVLVGIVLDYFLFCLVRAVSAGRGGGDDGMIAFVLIVLTAPALAAGAFAVMARLAALQAPPESHAKPTATTSLLCSLAGLGCLVILAITLLAGLDSSRTLEAPLVVAVGGLVLSVLGSVATFFGFAVQVGMVHRSPGISRAVGRMAVAVCSCLFGLIGIGVLYALISEMTAPAYSGVHRSHDHEAFYAIASGILLPMALAVVLIFYHRLLAAGRRAVRGEPEGRYDG